MQTEGRNLQKELGRKELEKKKDIPFCCKAISTALQSDKQYAT
mgnify:CR=1 FL=1|jgi:hypothetical protein